MAVDDRQLPIQSPCPIDLDRSGINAADRAMHCAHCDKDVHLLSQMTEADARQLMKDRSGDDICVSYAIQRDGQIRFRAPESTLVPASALFRARRPSPVRALAQAMTLGATAMLAACTSHGEPLEVGAIATDDTVTTVQMPVIPDEPCDPNEDLLVDGGIIAEPIPEPIAEPEARRRGGIRARPILPPELTQQVAGGLVASPLADPLD